ncbi:S41 family peptidase [Insolitispirillum peregrinum]|uniref:S41 family peptidase n=1 Tax=Insolitispirillum peregrinum TaxID=80876 RepID=UPI003621A68C
MSLWPYRPGIANRTKATARQTTARGLGALLVAISLAACSTAPARAGTAWANAPASAPVSPAPTFSRSAVEKELGYVFDVIEDRYLDPVTAQSLALSALNGLQKIDTAISASLNGRTVVITRAERVIASEPAPPPDSATAWSSLCSQMIETLRTLSPELAKADNEALYTAMVSTALARLDSYSRYAGADEAERHRDSRNGFGGVGIRYQVERGFLNIEEVLPETPAAQAGLLPGDRVTHIDGVNIAALNDQREQVRERLRGPVDSELRLTILRTDREQDVLLRRGLVMPKSVFMETSDDGIATIRIASFNQQTAKHVQQAVDDAQAKFGGGLRGIMLDLRGNPGGLLDQAVAVSDLFLNRGRIVYTKGRHPDSLQSYSASPPDVAEGVPIVVLVDGRSASSAEILASALQDNGRAVVVGSNSYGKGTVQTVVNLPNNGEMTLTWSRFHAPSGYTLHNLGVLPTICVTSQAEAPSETLARTLPPLSGNETARMSSTLADWRATPLWDEKSRTHLRQTCPATDQEKWAAPIGIGRELLHNPALFVRALASTSPQWAQR